MSRELPAGRVRYEIISISNQADRRQLGEQYFDAYYVCCIESDIHNPYYAITTPHR